MSRSWFDQVDQAAEVDDDAAVLAGDGSGDDADDYPTAVLRTIGVDEADDRTVDRRAVRRVVPPPKRSASWAPFGQSSRTAVVAVGAAVAVGLAVIGGAVALRGGDDPQVPATVALTSPQAGTPASSSTSSVGVAGDCAPVDGQVAVSADTSTLRGAVVAFERAYYGRDAESLSAVVARGSGLAATDWDSVLPEAAPDGVEWCVVMQPTTGSSVTVDLTVTMPDGDVTTYPQTISGEQSGGTWQLVSVSAR